MTVPLCVNLAYEDDLSGAVLVRLLAASGRPFEIAERYCRGGYGYLRRIMPGLNNAARGMPYLVLTDLDVAECPPVLLREWLPRPRHPNLLLRVAVREVESWLIADRDGLAGFLGIPKEFIGLRPEALPDPKRELIRLASKSRRRELRADIVPRQGSTSTQGPLYGSRMVQFVEERWNPLDAARRSASLARTMQVIAEFAPLPALQ